MKHLKPSFPALVAPLLINGCGVTTKPTKEVPIVMLHGIFDNSASMTPLRMRLEQAGYQCHTPDLSPSSGKDGIEPLTNQLSQYISEEIGDGNPYHLVGYSMGGIVARSYLKDSPNRNSCQSLSTLASPHHGTQIAKLYPLQAGIELRPNSNYLNNLNQNSDSYHPRTLSIRTALDGVIIPSSSSELKGAKNIRLITPSHPSLLLSKRVSEEILTHVGHTEQATMKNSLQ